MLRVRLIALAAVLGVAAVTLHGCGGNASAAGQHHLPGTCDASIPPTNGGVGDCTASLAPGDFCMVSCNIGYGASGLTTCADGKLTAATCQSCCDNGVWCEVSNGGFSKDSEGNCVQCSKHCSFCSSATMCTVCSWGYQVSSEGTCVSNGDTMNLIKNGAEGVADLNEGNSVSAMSALNVNNIPKVNHREGLAINPTFTQAAPSDKVTLSEEAVKAIGQEKMVEPPQLSVPLIAMVAAVAGATAAAVTVFIMRSRRAPVAQESLLG